MYLHKIGCKKVEICVKTSLAIKRLSVVEACIKIQREVRKFLSKKQLSFCFHDEYSESYRYLKHIGSDFSSKHEFQEVGFLEQILLTSSALKNYREGLGESIDFELSGTFK